MKRIISALILQLAVAASVHAGSAPIIPTNIPTLGEGGLIALVALVGVIGGFIARRRRK